MTNRYRKATLAGALLLFGAAGCADLVVDNTNNPDRRRALATPGDVESLVAGSYKSWYGGEEWESSTTGSSGAWMGVASFMWSSTAANLGILEYSKIPRVPVQNTTTHQEYPYISDSWTRHYRALASIGDGLRTIQSDTTVSNGLGANKVLRARIFGKFVQGLAHGSLGLVYDRGYVVTEAVQVVDANGAPVSLGEPVTYQQLVATALAQLDTAIALAGTAPAAVTIPAAWMGTPADVGMPELIRIANSFKARYRANVARTPAERAAVNWQQVLVETGAGIKADFNTNRTTIWSSWTNSGTLAYMQSPTFQQLTYMVHGMADTSGAYQTWINRPVASRDAVNPDGSPVLIRTPDRRFPRGDTLFAATAVLAGADTMKAYRNQIGGRIARPAATPTASRTLDTVTINNIGKYFHIRTNAAGTQPNVSFQWSQPARGSWRWSWYASRELDPDRYASGNWPEIDYDEMRMLAAEAHFRRGNLQQAADSINVTRVANGLSATSAAGANTSCVPRLPNGQCGNLFEMLKWEKRMELWGKGPYKASWYFDGRGWGDLYRGTPLHLPMPEEQAIVSGVPVYTFGGVGGQGASPGSSYSYPGE